MSTLVYAQLTSRRENAKPDESGVALPGVQSYVDIFAALVPSEVLLAHAAVLSFTTTTEKSPDGGTMTTITQPGTLKGVFVALLLLSILLYVAGHLRHWDRLDFARMFIPPLAFVGWTMLQKATAFDAFAPGLGQASRDAIAVIGAVVLGVFAALLAYQADQKNAVPAPQAGAAGGE